MTHLLSASDSNQSKLAERTRFTYLAIRALDTPLWAIYNMLLIILYKDMHATPFQLAFLVSLKPLTSVASFYFTHLMTRLRLTQTILVARFVGIALFLLFPFVESIGFILAAYGLYMAMAVGTVPAWLELMKNNLGEAEQKQTFAFGSSLGYLGGAILPFVFAFFLDHYQYSWKWIFFGAALLSLASTFLVLRITTFNEKIIPLESNPFRQISFSFFTDPWKRSFRLLRQRPDFAAFQASFMILGSGLMILQPAMPVYFVDELHLTYVELALALSLCKGISYAAASPFFARKLHDCGIFRFSGIVSCLAVLFPLFLMMAKWEILFVYISYIVYGVMQAGSELAWNMSGPLFAGQQESRPYTSLNIITVALRGALAPAIGAYLLGLFGSFWVQAIGAVVFLFASLAFSLGVKENTARQST